MNEHEITKKLRAAIEKIMPVTASVLRHVDMTQSGIPDLSYHHGQHTTWFEIKYIGPDGKLKQSALQKRNILKLSRGAKVRYIIFFEKTKTVQAFRAEDVSLTDDRAGLSWNFEDVAASMLGMHNL